MTADTGNSTLAGHAARGALITISSQVGRIAILVVSTVVLARLLTPSDFGVLAIVLAIIGFGEIFRDFGLSQATIQAKHLSTSERTNVFWINTAIGMVLSLLLAAMAHPLSNFVGDDRVYHVALALAPTFLLNGLSAQYRADLNRNLRFAALAACDLIPAAGALALSILAALIGWGYWALVVNQLGVGILSVLLLPLFCRWLPRFYDRDATIRPLLNYGGNLLGVQAIVYISRNIDRVIIAGSLGTAQLGVYDRAYQLLMMPLNQINAPANRVALPVLSKLAEDKRYNAYLVRGQTIVLHVLTAIFGLATALAGVLIPFVLGEQWAGSVPIFQAFALAGFAQAAGYVTYWVFLSKGLMRANLRYTLCTRPIMIGAVFLGSIWGGVGIAWSYSIVLFLMWPLGIWWIGRLTTIPVRSLLWAGGRCLLIYATAGLCAWIVMSQTSLDHPIELLGIGGGTYVIALGVLMLLIPRFRDDAAQILALRRLAKRRL